MKGLGAELPTADQGQQPRQQAPGGGGIGSSMIEASPEEQDLYDRFVSMATMVIWNEQMIGPNIERLKSSPDPAAVAGEIASQAAQRVVARAAEDGIQIPPDVILHGGEEIVGQVVDLAEKAGIELSDDDVERAWYAAADDFGQSMTAQGVYTDELHRADAEDLKAMADDGTVDRILAELAAQRGGQAPMSEGV